ncbi:MAG: hypothetical protein NTY42_18530 [Planctomycetota bacterium]|jgi:hypothetical protein|nr:hypothetical protein [Planctomycetota bacterium]
MDRQELIDWVKRGPVRVTMSDGSTHVIPSLEWCLITPVSAHVLYRAEDGKLRTHYLSLVCMARVEQLETSEIL